MKHEFMHCYSYVLVISFLSRCSTCITVSRLNPRLDTWRENMTQVESNIKPPLRDWPLNFQRLNVRWAILALATVGPKRLCFIRDIFQ